MSSGATGSSTESACINCPANTFSDILQGLPCGQAVCTAPTSPKPSGTSEAKSSPTGAILGSIAGVGVIGAAFYYYNVMKKKTAMSAADDSAISTSTSNPVGV